MKFLSEQFIVCPALNKMMSDPTILPTVKIDLLTTAAGKEISESCHKTIHLIVRNKRTQYMLFIAASYDQVYRKAKNLAIMKLITTEPVSNEVKNKLVDLVKQNKDKVEFITETNADLIGGFILEIEDIRLDASVKNLLFQLRQKLIHS
jgi:F-type H+-transporting ATPase subunit delta